MSIPLFGYRIKNFCAHDVDFFPYAQCITTRNGKQILKGELGAKYVIPQDEVYNIDVPPNNVIVEQCTGCFYPKICVTPIIPPNYQEADIIIVSRYYATQLLRYPRNIPPDYLDRLFITIPLYKEKTIGEKKNLVRNGCVGFEKLSLPHHPSWYFNAIKTYQPVSVVALQQAINYYDANPTAPVYNDPFIHNTCIPVLKQTLDQMRNQIRNQLLLNSRNF